MNNPDYFCQWCYDRGLRYPDNGKPWVHAKDCPNRHMEHVPTEIREAMSTDPLPADPTARFAEFRETIKAAQATSDPSPSAPLPEPCPFCGKEPETCHSLSKRRQYARCGECNIAWMSIETWNRRAGIHASEPQEVQRYFQMGSAMCPSPTGDWIHVEDYQTALAATQAKLRDIYDEAIEYADGTPDSGPTAKLANRIMAILAGSVTPATECAFCKGQPADIKARCTHSLRAGLLMIPKPKGDKND